MAPRYALIAAVLGMMVVTSALAPRPHKSPVLQKPPSQALSPRWPAGIGAVAAAALAVAPQASWADASVLAETGDVSAWAASLGSQDKVAIVVLAFLVVVVIPALVSDLLETQKDPAAAIAKKQQKRVAPRPTARLAPHLFPRRLKDLENKYSFVPGAKAPGGPALTPEEAAKAAAAAKKAEAENDEADELLASVNALLDK